MERSLYIESLVQLQKKKRTSSQIIQRKKGTDINTRRLSESTKRFKKKEGERKEHRSEEHTSELQSLV